MSQSLTKIVLHITFSTKYRQPLIDDLIQPHLFAYIAKICSELGCTPLRVGGFYDHIHIVCLLSKKILVSKLLEEVKKNSSKWIKTQGTAYEKFYWQDGYAAFSVHAREYEVVCDYVDRQKKHHLTEDYKTELIQFFNRYGIDYDERYLWD